MLKIPKNGAKISTPGASGHYMDAEPLVRHTWDHLAQSSVRVQAYDWTGQVITKCGALRAPRPCSDQLLLASKFIPIFGDF